MWWIEYESDSLGTMYFKRITASKGIKGERNALDAKHFATEADAITMLMRLCSYFYIDARVCGATASDSVLDIMVMQLSKHNNKETK